MAFSEPNNDIEIMRPPEGSAYSFSAGSAVTAGQVVKLTGDEQVAPVDTGGEGAIGVATQTVSSGDDVNVIGTGARVRLVAGGSISVNDLLTPSTGTNNGEVGTASTSGDETIGTALTSAASQGDVIKAVIEVGGEIN